MEDKNVNTTGMQEADAAEEQKTEMQQAQASGTVDFNKKKEEKQASLNYTHKFIKPVTIMGKQYSSMPFYYENLTGDDLEAIEAEMQAQNLYALSPEISGAFQSRLAARAAGVASDEIRHLPMKDYMKIKNSARDFLLSLN